jgi:hypothetical protein
MTFTVHKDRYYGRDFKPRGTEYVLLSLLNDDVLSAGGKWIFEALVPRMLHDVEQEEDEAAALKEARQALVGYQPQVCSCWESDCEHRPNETETPPDHHHPAVVSAGIPDSMIFAREEPQPYSLIPECRTCYRVFAFRQGLRSHLAAKTSHKIAFRRKRYNTLVPWASRFPTRVCWTCARNCGNLSELQRHLEKNPDHQQHGMLPRWTEDNAALDRYWKNK